MGRILSDFSCIGRMVAAVHSGSVEAGRLPRDNRNTRLVRAERPFTPACGETELTAIWRRRVERRSGPAAEEGLRERHKRRTAASLMSGGRMSRVGSWCDGDAGGRVQSLKTREVVGISKVGEWSINKGAYSAGVLSGTCQSEGTRQISRVCEGGCRRWER